MHLFGSFKVSRTGRGYVKCNRCKRKKSLKQLRREVAILTGFYQLQPAYRLTTDIGTDYQTITRVYQRLRETIYHVAELEAGKLKGEIEIDEAYFGGRRKGKRGRGAAGKSIVFGYHFQRYLKEVEYRFNHRKDNLFKLFLHIYFGYFPTNYLIFFREEFSPGVFYRQDLPPEYF